MTEKRITRQSHGTPATPCREKKTPSDENRPEFSRKRQAEDKPRKPGKQKVSKLGDDSAPANAQKTPKQNEEYTQYPSMVCRSSPKVLVDAIAKLNEPQKKAVEEMGLGNIMHLTIKEIPGKLAYWLVEHFHAKSCSLQLPDSKNLHFDEEDVGLTLGVPRGPTIIKRKSKHVECAILNDWIRRVGKPKKSITPKDIRNAMMGEADGGDWFKRHFLILMIACLFENVGSGYILPKVIEEFQEISEVKHLNWCRFVIEVLIEHHVRWERNKSAPFKGPIIFLMALYVDRVIVFTRTVPRAFPAVKGWDCKAIKLRETKELHGGGFGVGHVDKRYKRVDIKNLPKMQPCKSKKSELVPQGNVGKSKDVGTSDTARGNVSSLSGKKLTPSTTMSDSMEMLMDLVDEAATEMMQNESLKKVLGASHGLLGLNTVVASTQAEQLEKSHEHFYGNDIVMGDEHPARQEEIAPKTTVEKGSKDIIDPPVLFENQNALPHESSGREEVQEEHDGDVEDTVCVGDGNPKGQEELVVKTTAKKDSEHIIDPPVPFENQNALLHESPGRHEMEEIENQNVPPHERVGNEVVEAEVKLKPYSKPKLPLVGNISPDFEAGAVFDREFVKRKLPLVGNLAPDFEAGAVFDRQFIKVKLSEYIGKKYVVLFFYPLDFTFVCPTVAEITAFSDRYGEFQKLNTEILGVSTDSVFSHLAWIQRDRKSGGLGELAYPLVSDITKSISKAYDVLIPDQGIALRGLFIIDKGGVIQHSTINNLAIGRSVDETLRTLEALQCVEDNPDEVCLGGWKPGEKSMRPEAEQGIL